MPAHVGAVKMVKMGSLLGTTRGWRMITAKKCMLHEFFWSMVILSKKNSSFNVLSTLSHDGILVKFAK